MIGDRTRPRRGTDGHVGRAPLHDTSRAGRSGRRHWLNAGVQPTVDPSSVFVNADTELVPESELIRWFDAGSPPEVLIGVGSESCIVATPVGEWEGAHRLYYRAGDPQSTIEIYSEDRLDRIRAAAEAATAARRKEFLSCRYCRMVFGPEQWLGDCCMGCASTYLSVVY